MFGIRTTAAGWWAQADPLCYDSRPTVSSALGHCLQWKKVPCNLSSCQFSPLQLNNCTATLNQTSKPSLRRKFFCINSLKCCTYIGMSISLSLSRTLLKLHSLCLSKSYILSSLLKLHYLSLSLKATFSLFLLKLHSLCLSKSYILCFSKSYIISHSLKASFSFSL